MTTGIKFRGGPLHDQVRELMIEPPTWIQHQYWLNDPSAPIEFFANTPYVPALIGTEIYMKSLETQDGKLIYKHCAITFPRLS